MTLAPPCRMLRPMLAFRVAGVLMILLFLAAAAVQYNDPDPAIWILVYLAAAVDTALVLARRLVWQAPLALAVATLVWALTLVPAAHGQGWSFDGEETRELGGLVIISLWSAVLAVAARRTGPKGRLA